METRIIKKERLEGLWSCLPEEVRNTENSTFGHFGKGLG